MYVSTVVFECVQAPLTFCNLALILIARALQLMMFDLDPSVSANFMNTPEDVVHKSVTVKAGIDTIMPDAEIQEWAFTPCGYSCNAQLGEAYHTIHVTPESHCSYASFETNIKLPSYTAIISRVLKLFKPKVCVCVLSFACIAVLTAAAVLSFSCCSGSR